MIRHFRITLRFFWIAEFFPYAKTTDLDVEALTFEAISNPQSGQLVLDSVSGDYTYTAYAGQYGEDSFEFVAHDASCHSVAATVRISIWHSYTLIDLGNNADIHSTAVAINNVGEVVGNFSTALTPTDSIAYVYDNSATRIALSSFTASDIADRAIGMSTGGSIIGHRVTQGTVDEAIVYDRNAIISELSIGAFRPTAINSLFTVIGNDASNAYRYNAGFLTTFLGLD